MRKKKSRQCCVAQRESRRLCFFGLPMPDRLCKGRVYHISHPKRIYAGRSFVGLGTLSIDIVNVVPLT